MMKAQQQQQQGGMGGGVGMNGGGGGEPTTRWCYRGPDGEVYGPYAGREMLTWSKTGYFTDALLIKTDNDEAFHTIGEWTQHLGQIPFMLPNVPSFEQLLQAAAASRGGPQQPNFLMFPPGLGPPPAPFVASRGGSTGAGGHQLPPLGMPPLMGGMPPMHPHFGPLSQPPSEPNDCASSASHTPDSAEHEFRNLHMPPPQLTHLHQQQVAQQHHQRLLQQQQQQQAHQQQQHANQQQQNHHAAMAAAQFQQQQQMQQNIHNLANTHLGGGQQNQITTTLQLSRSTSTADAPWLQRRDISIDATTGGLKTTNISTQTLPVIIGSKDASRLLSDMCGCQIIIN